MWYHLARNTSKKKVPLQKKVMLKSAIFDMDGLLIDSEPLWRRAEIKVFDTVGIHLTDEQCRTTTGLRVDLLVQHWDTIMPNKIKSISNVANGIVEEVIALVKAEGIALPGVHNAIEMVKKLGMTTAIASASPMSLINAVVDKFNLSNHFDIIETAEHLRYGKPHPEVFINTADKLKQDPTNCLVFEDSIYGIIAGKAARMKVIAVPDQAFYNRKEYSIVDVKLKSLLELTPQIIKEL